MAKKKYYQSRRDRRREREGAYYSMAKRDYRKADYDWERMKESEGRRAQEALDGDMIREDHSAMANLPREVVMKEYPPCPYGRSDVPDGIRGIDRQIDRDHRKMMDNQSNEKY